MNEMKQTDIDEIKENDNSDKGFYWGIGLAFAGLGIGAGFMLGYLGYFHGKSKLANIELEIERVKAGYVLQERLYENNTVKDSFYQIGENRAYVIYDGNNLESLADI